MNGQHRGELAAIGEVRSARHRIADEDEVVRDGG
jgi:hypothetical protein